jgi:TfoX/Sxy family transcriptional regulator of competence genes
MAYNEKLADITREILAQTQDNIEEKKMFGGLCFMVNDKMCMGVIKDRLMVRFNPEMEAVVMEQEGCSPMDFSGKAMQGFAWVELEALKTTSQLAYWVKLALEYNKIAKPAKKKGK